MGEQGLFPKPQFGDTCFAGVFTGVGRAFRRTFGRNNPVFPSCGWGISGGDQNGGPFNLLRGRGLKFGDPGGGADFTLFPGDLVGERVLWKKKGLTIKGRGGQFIGGGGPLFLPPGPPSFGVLRREEGFFLSAGGASNTNVCAALGEGSVCPPPAKRGAPFLCARLFKNQGGAAIVCVA